VDPVGDVLARAGAGSHDNQTIDTSVSRYRGNVAGSACLFVRLAYCCLRDALADILATFGQKPALGMCVIHDDDAMCGWLEDNHARTWAHGVSGDLGS
jgi:hypothetical protein